MKRLLATLNGAAAAVAFGVLISVPAQADPVTCPFDMTTEAGRQASAQSFDNFSAQVRAINAESNAKIAAEGPDWARGPEALANVERANQLIREREAQGQACKVSSLTTPVGAPNPAPAQQVPAATAACPYDMTTQQGRDAFQRHIVESSQRVSEAQLQPNGTLAGAVDSINDERNTSNITLACQGIDAPPLPQLTLPQEPQPTAPEPYQSTACRDLNNAWSTLDPAVPGVDRILQLRKLPGFGLVSGAQLIGCGISGIPNAIANPSPENNEEVFTGICNGLNPLPVDVCGNTPVR